MADSAGSRRLTRRGVVKAAAAVAAFGLSLLRGRNAEAAIPRTVYVFDPSTEGSGCVGCAACRRHAANKVFASREAADARRAHPHCRCAIVAVTVPTLDFVRMFGAPDGPRFRGEFDVRWTEVMGGLEMPAAE